MTTVAGFVAFVVPGVERPSAAVRVSMIEPCSRRMSTRDWCCTPLATSSRNATAAYEESPPVPTLGRSALTSLAPPTLGTSACSNTTLGAVPRIRRV